jgi:glycosyltransferase involved in cell wall biosynthesis
LAVKILVVHNFYSSDTGEDLAVREMSEWLRAGLDRQCVEYVRHSADFARMGFFRKVRELVRANLPFYVPSDFAKLLDRERPNVAMIHNLCPLINPFILEELYRRKIPVVAVVHNYRYICPKGTCYHRGEFCDRCLGHTAWQAFFYNCLGNAAHSLVYAWRGLWWKRLMNCVDIFLVPSLSAKTFYEKTFPGRRVEVHGEYVSIPAAFQKGSAVKEPVAVFAGRIVEEKGVGLILEAARGLPQVLFKICGEGPLLDFYRTLALRQELNNVQFFGFLPREELLALVRSARILVVPSLWEEVYGRVTQEAMLLETAVVASNRGASSELVEDGRTGFLFDPRQTGALAAVIDRIWDDEALRRKVCAEARRRAESVNDPDRLLSGLKNILALL